MPGNEVCSISYTSAHKQTKKNKCVPLWMNFLRQMVSWLSFSMFNQWKAGNWLSCTPNFMWERDPRGVTADFPYHCIHNRGTAHGTARGSRHGVGIHHMYLAHGEWTDLQNLKHGMPQKPIGFRPHFGIDTAVVRCFSVFSICGPINIIYKYIYIYVIIYIYDYICSLVINHGNRKSCLWEISNKWITKIRMTATCAPQYSLLL